MASESNSADPISARHTVIVEGSLSFHARRLAAAKTGARGLQIYTAPHLAARLAGGFRHPARTQELHDAIRNALDAGGFEDIENLRALPGMTRALSRTLTKLWHADIDLSQAALSKSRLRDLLEVQRRVRAALPGGALILPDLRDAALARIQYAKSVLGDVEIDKRTDFLPIWRSLISALMREVQVTWRAPSVATDWFSGNVIPAEMRSNPLEPGRVSCANPRSEVIEALRWVRERLENGVLPGEIALCAVNPEIWDDHFDALGSDAALPLHFSHGRSALATYDGQACAALADVLIQGLSQRRVRRLLRYVRGSKALAALPYNWARGVERDAALFTVQHWQNALDSATATRDDGFDPRPLLMPVITLLAGGPGAAKDAGTLLLGHAGGAIWTEALRRAPESALLLSLPELRLPDRRGPGNSVVWCPAHELAETPRPYVRLLGLNAQSWPRRGSEDPLLPNHAISGGMLDRTWITKEDRRNFRLILEAATKECVISRSRRDPQGKALSPSSLATGVNPTEIALKRARIPQYAFSEADRILARPEEAREHHQVKSASQCWQNRQSRVLTAHDGLVRPEHPVVIRAIEQAQSATSLRSLLRDPLGFLWRYGLRWLAPAIDEQPLSLDPRVHGELVHDILKYAVQKLEPSPGFRQADPREIESAVAYAKQWVRESWPLERPVPPAMLWDHTLNLAAELAELALNVDPRLPQGSQSWPEVLFGQKGASSQATSPWSTDTPVPVPGTSFKLRGKIDRLDIRADDTRRAAQVTDYKTGKLPETAIILDGGRELQRVTYSLAVKHLRPDMNVLQARLVYLSKDAATPLPLGNIDRAITTLTRNLGLADGLLRSGIALPGPDAEEDTYDLRLAHAAARRIYFGAKRGLIHGKFGSAYVESWECP